MAKYYIFCRASQLSTIQISGLLRPRYYAWSSSRIKILEIAREGIVSGFNYMDVFNKGHLIITDIGIRLPEVPAGEGLCEKNKTGRDRQMMIDACSS